MLQKARIKIIAHAIYMNTTDEREMQKTTKEK